MIRTAYDLSDWQHYLSHEEIDVIKRGCAYMPSEPNVLCIGAGAGTAAFAVLEELDDVLYYSVDIKSDEQETTTNEHLRLQETTYYDEGRVIRIWGDSHIVGKHWRVPLDMLIIDGDHSEFGISEDLRLWVPHVKRGGVILCHDYGSSNWPHVERVIDICLGAHSSGDRELQFCELGDSMIKIHVKSPGE